MDFWGPHSAVAQSASKLKKLLPLQNWRSTTDKLASWNTSPICFWACLFIHLLGMSWEDGHQLLGHADSSLLKETASSKSLCLMMYQNGANQSVLSPIAQDSSERSSQFQKVILRGNWSSSLYKQSYFLPSLSTAMENSCLKRFWSVSHSPETVSERSHPGWSVKQLLGN